MSEIVQRLPHTPHVPPGGMDLHARDMTATFSADCPLRFVQWKLAEIGQWLPVDGAPDATIGQLVESNSTGPLRLGFGAWRDLLLGAQFTNGRGELITAGGRTVKNVAGYDLTKFMVGSHGVFGRLVTVTARTYARPAGALLVKHAPTGGTAGVAAPPFAETLERHVGVLAALLPTPMRPQWALLTSEALWCGYLADVRTLDWYEANAATAGADATGAGGASPPVEISRRGVQDDIDHRAALWRAGEGTPFRASVPPAKLPSFVSQLTPGEWVADPAFGIVLGSVADDAQRQPLRDAAAQAGGTLVFGAGRSLDVSTNPAERQIIERLKAAFDPDNRLNPLPWQTR
jgi:FAD/FMN-containing dehydrogenase